MFELVGAGPLVGMSGLANLANLANATQTDTIDPSHTYGNFEIGHMACPASTGAST